MHTFCIGALWGWFADTSWFQAWGQPLLVTGMLGGFTTFSAFSIETINLFNDKGLLFAGVYAGLSVAGCIGAAALALRLFSS